VRDPRIGSSAQIRLTLEWRPCRFGERRPLFRCLMCSRSTLGLFQVFYKWQCRRCAHLSYESQNQGELDRAVARVNALRWELDPADAGFDVNMSAFRDVDRIPQRPKGMRLETYQRMLEWIREGEHEARVLLFNKLKLLPIHEPRRTRARQRKRSRR
jgi:hypothetical protein